MRLFEKFAVSTLALALMFIAKSGVSANCWFITYEPNIPESLKR